MGLVLFIQGGITSAYIAPILPVIADIKAACVFDSKDIKGETNGDERSKILIFCSSSYQMLQRSIGAFKDFGGGRLSIRNFSASAARSKQRVVILGSGWGGYNVLRGIDKKRWGEFEPVSEPSAFSNAVLKYSQDVTVLSPNTFFNFTPLLAGTAVGTLEFRCAVEPVRRYTPEVVGGG